MSFNKNLSCQTYLHKDFLHMIHKITAAQFIQQSHDSLIIDVRSPQEFIKGHIPGAKNIALFSDDERAVVGTLYKQQGKERAVLQGLQLVGPKLADFIIAVQSFTDKKTVFIYCWRGGMRSSSFAWLLHTYGYEVFLLQGGYKAFRNFALQAPSKKLDLIVVSGKTGTGKTILLHDFDREGKQVIDLEGLARHKGSVFGGLGQKQPTQEQFENNVALLLDQLKSDEPTWIEDESRKIGKIIIPAGLWDQMRQAPIFFIEKTKQKRMDLLMQEYGLFTTEDLLHALQGIEKHIGSQRYLQAQTLLQNNDRISFCSMLIDYYDQAYNHSLIRRQKQLKSNSHSDKISL